jgi:hypothetical protein
VPKKRQSRPDRLYALIERQGGYFTAADAKALGYGYPLHYFHVQQGNWIRVAPGTFRLKRFPSVAHDDLIRWWLWSRKLGVISHQSAARVYGVELPPGKVFRLSRLGSQTNADGWSCTRPPHNREVDTPKVSQVPRLS